MTYVDLHNHTEYSVLDGEQTSAEAVAVAVANGDPALAITDHGNCGGHVRHQAECLRAGLSPIFGMETYFQRDRLERPDPGDKEAQKRLWGGSHLVLLAQDDQGLRDMWAASSEAFATGLYHRPRMDWELLEKFGSRWIVTSACLGGIISQDLLARRYGKAFATLDRMKALFGDRLYLEMQANGLADQARLNQMLAVVSQESGVPLVVASDAHYPSEAERELHRIWMLCQSGKGKEDYWHFSPMLAEDRTRAMLSYLDPKAVESAIRSTTEIAARCTARIGGQSEPPVFTPGGTAADDARRLREMCERGWHRVPDRPEYRDRLEREYEMVAAKGLAGCYLIVEDIVSWARSQGVLVGPGRGSAAGSLMSYLLEITSIDPLRAGLMFERFLTPGRVSLPDFDLDFPSSKRGMIQDYAIRRHGADHVVRVGTVMRYGAKGILNKLFSVLGSILPDSAEADGAQLSRLIDEAEAGTAGLGLPWDDIVADPDIAEYAARYRSVFAIASQLHGRVYALGQHPAGLIISPGRSLAGFMPMRRAESGSALMVSQFDYRAADDLNLCKIDFLTLRTLDSLQEAIELVEERNGTRIDPWSWDVEYEDPQVYDEIGTGKTLGMFQIETRLCQDYCSRMRPRTVDELADLTTGIRPGPRNSGAMEAYLRRRSGLEEVDYPHPDLVPVLEGTYGVMLYQEQILRVCRVLAGYDDLEADAVRKILGKKLTEKVAAAGEEFIRRCAGRGHDPEMARELWAKMAEFGKYAFNRAHGYSYATLTYWTSWMNVHYPVPMITGILSTIGDMDRMAEFAMEARRKGILVLPPDVRASGARFTADSLTIRYGLESIPKVGPQAIAKIVAAQPYLSWEDFRDRAGVNSGVLRALAKGGALDSLAPSRQGLLRVIDADRDGFTSRCVHKADEQCGPGGLPCTYDWASEPRPAPRIGKRGQELKVIVKPPPAKCTVACRRYTPPEVLRPGSFAEYTPSELFRQDWETYGCWMSPAPFEQLRHFGDGMRQRARDVALMAGSGPPGSYPVPAVLAEVRPARTRSGSAMWWVTLATEVSLINAACFQPRRDDEPDVPSELRAIRQGTLVLAELVRRSYKTPGGVTRLGWNLAAVQPVGR